MELKTLEKKLWKIFSRYIRQRDTHADGLCRCCSCGRLVAPNACDAGHYISRRFKSVMFNEKNVHAQCKGCNNWGRTDPEVHRRYGEFIDKKYGAGTADTLKILAKLSASKDRKSDYRMLIEHYSKEIE